MLTINSLLKTLIFNGFGDLVWMMNIFIKEFKFSWHFLTATGSKYPLVDFCLSQGGRSRFLSNSGTIRDPAPAQSGRGTTQAVTYHQNTNLTLKAKQKIILEKRETSRRLHINKSIECWPSHPQNKAIILITKIFFRPVIDKIMITMMDHVVNNTTLLAPWLLAWKHNKKIERGFNIKSKLTILTIW